MSIIGKIRNKIMTLYYRRSSESYSEWLRKQGVKVGKNCRFRHPSTIRIDVSRPSLVSIGDNVGMNMNFQILTHDWVSAVFRSKYDDYVNSSGAVTIGSNVYFGTNVCVLKGVTIGDYCVIGAGSIVTKDIPANSVATGAPCKVVCTLDEYYAKRKQKAKGEAVEFVRSFKERFNRLPNALELREEFIYFIDESNIDEYPGIRELAQMQLGPSFEGWLKCHKKDFEDYESFMQHCLDEDVKK